MRILFAFLFSLVLIGCGGYQPVAQYSKDIFAQPVLVKVKIDPEDPSTGEYLQDEILRMAINRLNLSTTKNVNKAKSYILVNSYTINTTPVTKDKNGNVIRYSINAAIEFAVKDKKGFWSKNIVSSEYVGVKAESSVSQVAKDKASKIAIKKALDNFVLAVIKRGQKYSKDEVKNSESKDNNITKQENNSFQDTQVDNAEDTNTSNETNIDNSDNSIYGNEDKPLINLVVVDDDNAQSGDNMDLNSSNENSTEIINY